MSSAIGLNCSSQPGDKGRGTEVECLAQLWRAAVALPPPGREEDLAAHDKAHLQRKKALQILAKAHIPADAAKDVEQQLAQEVSGHSEGQPRLLNHLEAMVQAIVGTSDKYHGLPQRVRLSMARDVFEALPLFLRLLRRSFLLPDIGQPMLDLFVVGFQAVGSDKGGDLPLLCFQTWSMLAQLFQDLGQLQFKESRRKLLLQPITFAILHDHPAPIGQEAISCWRRILDLLLQPSAANAPPHLLLASAWMERLWLAMAGDPQGSRLEEGCVQRVRWDLIPVVTTAIKDVLRPDLVPVVAGCVSSFLRRGIRLDKPMDAQREPQVCAAFTAIAHLWGDLLHCFDSSAGEGPLQTAAASRLTQLCESLWHSAKQFGFLTKDRQTVCALVSCVTATMRNPLADLRPCKHEEPALKREDLGSSEGQESYTACNSVGGLDSSRGATSVQPTPIGLAGLMFDGLLDTIPGQILVNLYLGPAAKGKRVAKESLSCAAELGTRALESSLQLCDVTTESALLRLTHLFNSIGDSQTPLQTSLPIVQGLSCILTKEIGEIGTMASVSAYLDLLILHLDVWAALAGNFMKWLEDTVEVPEVVGEDTKILVNVLLDCGLASPLRCIIDGGAHGLFKNNRKVQIWSETWLGLYKALTTERVLSEGNEQRMMKVLSSCLQEVQILENVEVVDFCTTLVLAMADGALKRRSITPEEAQHLGTCAAILLSDRCWAGVVSQQDTVDIPKRASQLAGMIIDFCGRSCKHNPSVLLLLLPQVVRWPPLCTSWAGDYQGNFILCYKEILKLLKSCLRGIPLQLVYEEGLCGGGLIAKQGSPLAVRPNKPSGRHPLELDVGNLLRTVRCGSSTLQAATCRFWLSEAVQNAKSEVKPAASQKLLSAVRELDEASAGFSASQSSQFGGDPSFSHAQRTPGSIIAGARSTFLISAALSMPPPNSSKKPDLDRNRNSVQETPAATSGTSKRKLRGWDPASQTEYVRIPSSKKKKKAEVLTDHQEAVRARQRTGVVREGIVTYTRLDAASQDPLLLSLQKEACDISMDPGIDMAAPASGDQAQAESAEPPSGERQQESHRGEEDIICLDSGSESVVQCSSDTTLPEQDGESAAGGRDGGVPEVQSVGDAGNLSPGTRGGAKADGLADQRPSQCFSKVPGTLDGKRQARSTASNAASSPRTGTGTRRTRPAPSVQDRRSGDANSMHESAGWRSSGAKERDSLGQLEDTHGCNRGGGASLGTHCPGPDRNPPPLNGFSGEPAKKAPFLVPEESCRSGQQGASDLVPQRRSSTPRAGSPAKQCVPMGQDRAEGGQAVAGGAEMPTGSTDVSRGSHVPDSQDIAGRGVDGTSEAIDPAKFYGHESTHPGVQSRGTRGAGPIQTPDVRDHGGTGLHCDVLPAADDDAHDGVQDGMQEGLPDGMLDGMQDEMQHEMLDGMQDGLQYETAEGGQQSRASQQKRRSRSARSCSTSRSSRPGAKPVLSASQSSKRGNAPKTSASPVVPNGKDAYRGLPTLASGEEAQGGPLGTPLLAFSANIIEAPVGGSGGTLVGASGPATASGSKGQPAASFGKLKALGEQGGAGIPGEPVVTGLGDVGHASPHRRKSRLQNGRNDHGSMPLGASRFGGERGATELEMPTDSQVQELEISQWPNVPSDRLMPPVHPSASIPAAAATGGGQVNGIETSSVHAVALSVLKHLGLTWAGDLPDWSAMSVTKLAEVQTTLQVLQRDLAEHTSKIAVEIQSRLPPGL
eukprot:jgi/Botrbrau1/19193/Bobra.0077s0098.2